MATATRTGIAIDYDRAVPMSDGTVLAADVFRLAVPGRYPVILIRTPYDKLASVGMVGGYGLDALAAVREGYVVVVQDCRGTGASQGQYRKFFDDIDDGAESVGWAAAQEWSNGSVGMAGPSYLGVTQMYAAMRTPPALKAIAPSVTRSANYEGAEYESGAFQLGRSLWGAATMALRALLRAESLGEQVAATDRELLEAIVADPWEAFRRLPLVDLPHSTSWLADYGDWLTHPDRGEFAREIAINEHYSSFDVAAMHIGGWFDVHLRGTLENYVGLRDGAATEHARTGQRLVITPWGHGPSGDVIGDLWLGREAAAVDFSALHIEFFDSFLKEESTIERPPVRIFVLGANRWRDEDDWPLARAIPTRFYLRSGGRLTREAPADERPDQFVYDPRDPVPTVGGNTLLPSSFFIGPRDRRAVQQRRDVVVYTSDILPEDTEITGPVTACLHIATSARDTDFTAALVDVYPDGRAIGIADGILRLRYRNGTESQQLAEPGRIYQIKVDLVATSNVFLAGHRIGVEISSSNFPRFDRNPNNGGVIAEAAENDLIPASQRIYHDADHASYITLPIPPSP